MQLSCKCRCWLHAVQAFMWQLDFAAAPALLKDLDHLLKVDDRIVRFVVLKRAVFGPLPTTHSVARHAMRMVPRRLFKE